jgi:tetratricopeptide (TPR) repeat protein
MIGEAYARAGSVELAEEQYIRILRLDQYTPQRVLQAAHFLLRYGKVDQTQRILDEARERAAADRDVLALQGQLRLARQDWHGVSQVADALRSLGDADSKDTADSILATALGGMGRYQDGIDLLEARLEAGHKNVLDDLVRAYVRAGRAADAEALLTSVISTDPGATKARILLGTLYASTARAELAERTLRNAVASADDDTATYTALAKFYLGAKRLEEAERTARDGLAVDEGESALQLLLALALEGSGRYNEAITIYEKMFAADPQSTMAANNLASLLSEHGSDANSLERAFAIALRFRTSQIPEFLDTLGWIYYLRGDYSQSLALLKTASEGLPDNGSVQFHLGMVLKQLGQNELATAKLKTAISLSETLTPSRLDSALSALEQLLTPEASAQPS